MGQNGGYDVYIARRLGKGGRRIIKRIMTARLTRSERYLPRDRHLQT